MEISGEHHYPHSSWRKFCSLSVSRPRVHHNFKRARYMMGAVCEEGSGAGFFRPKNFLNEALIFFFTRFSLPLLRAWICAELPPNDIPLISAVTALVDTLD